MIKIDAKNLLTGLAQLDHRTKAGAKLLGQIAADKMAIDAKQNAPWTNRTGLARKSIKGFCEWHNNNQLHIGISGGMEYSPYLEFCFNKKYAILYPTLLRHKNEIMKQMALILK